MKWVPKESVRGATKSNRLEAEKARRIAAKRRDKVKARKKLEKQTKILFHKLDKM